MEKEAGETGSAPHTLAALGVKGEAPPFGSRGGDQAQRKGLGSGRQGGLQVVLDHPGAPSVLRGFLVEQWTEV